MNFFRPICGGLLLAAFALSGCGAAEVSGVRRDQRILARRLADTRADVDSLRTEMARIRGQMQSAGFAPVLPEPQRGAASGATRDAVGVRGAGSPFATPGAVGMAGSAASGAVGAVAANPAGARWPAGGAAAAPRPMGENTGNAGWETPPPPIGVAGAASGAAPLGIDLRGDLARGPEEADYRGGLEAYQRGDYPRSVQSLRNYVSRNRGSSLAPYAHYWIGEAYFSQGKYYEAILAYNEIPTSWPDNDRVPAAKLRQAEAFAASGDVQDARIYLKELIEKYPGTPEAAEAQQRLRSL